MYFFENQSANFNYYHYICVRNQSIVVIKQITNAWNPQK